jgi:hypothetical protein
MHEDQMLVDLSYPKTKLCLPSPGANFWTSILIFTLGSLVMKVSQEI